MAGFVLRLHIKVQALVKVAFNDQWHPNSRWHVSILPEEDLEETVLQDHVERALPYICCCPRQQVSNERKVQCHQVQLGCGRPPRHVQKDPTTMNISARIGKAGRQIRTLSPS